MSVERPELGPSDQEQRDWDRAAQLYDISGEAGEMLGNYITRYPQLLKEHPQLAIIASNIVGMVFEKTCELLEIPQDIRSRILEGDE